MSERLKQARNTANLSTLDVERNTGLSKGNVSSWENAKFFPSAYALLLLSELYGVSVDWILKGKEFHEKADIEEVESILDEDLHFINETLKQLMTSNDPELKVWAKVQFKIAFGDYLKKLEQEE